MACAPNRSEPIGFGSATILLVDDEKQITHGLAVLLRGSARTVLEAHSGAEALEVFRRRTIDVVVSDERMPGMCGSEFLAVVSREFPDTGRVILTGHATVDAAARAINEGKVCRFLQKPCMPVALRDAVEQAFCAATQARTSARLLAFARREGIDLDLAIVHEAGFGPDLLATLSEREREVFNLMVDGLRLSQIARGLFISRHTTRNHLKAIFRKLDVHSQTELMDRSRGRFRP